LYLHIAGTVALPENLICPNYLKSKSPVDISPRL
jgi:hypothetical protein